MTTIAIFAAPQLAAPADPGFTDRYEDAYPNPHPLNTAGCCDGHGQVHHGLGALSYVTLCTDRDCGLRRDALFMGVQHDVLDAWWPR